jgi:hypothetical protein
MHQFTELVDRSAAFALAALKDVENSTLESLETSAETRLVKTLQTIQLAKVIMAVGMFSTFDAILQDQLATQNGFEAARKAIERHGHQDIGGRFFQFSSAINVLKHGRGRSYESLLADVDNLPFRMKRPDQYSFSEGDVSEVSTLIEVDDRFISACAEIIRDVSQLLERIQS